MTESSRASGWDAKVIQRIAVEHYGSLEGLFEAHKWPERGQAMLPAAGRHVVRVYQSIASFEASHLPDLLDVIEAQEPDVWLKSAYGFSPWDWGCLTFSGEPERNRFIEHSRPGALVVIYGARGASPDERGRILGVVQVGHMVDDTSVFLSAKGRAEKAEEQDGTAKWNFSVQVVRAWQVDPSARLRVNEFAPDTYWPGRAQHIGRRAAKLFPSEAWQLGDLPLSPVAVFGRDAVGTYEAKDNGRVFRPSRAGPVSKRSFMTRESEGPKHLYILRMEGNIDHLIGRNVGGRWVIKVGMSRHPPSRCADHNRALPQCAFRWQILRSTQAEGRVPFESSDPALTGEQAMVKWLDKRGDSLEGEFFLVDPAKIEDAWRHGLKNAEDWKP